MKGRDTFVRHFESGGEARERGARRLRLDDPCLSECRPTKELHSRAPAVSLLSSPGPCLMTTCCRYRRRTRIHISSDGQQSCLKRDLCARQAHLMMSSGRLRSRPWRQALKSGCEIIDVRTRVDNHAHAADVGSLSSHSNARASLRRSAPVRQKQAMNTSEREKSFGTWPAS